eukprot:g26534.t1
MTFSAEVQQRMLQKLSLLYGDKAADCLARIEKRAGQFSPPGQQNGNSQLWNQSDIALITYGDQIQTEGEPPLRTLDRFLKEVDVGELLQIVHILPFCPYSSDDGFSVIDYRAVDSNLGDWSDVAALNQSHDLMFDLVLNHCSSESAWFRDAIAGTEPYVDYFIEPAADDDLSGVTRPRSTPLLTTYETSSGPRDFWTTFSADQIDLNFANPDVLLEMLDILLTYVERGARIIRLDAIAYLWKQPGTSCIHLDETHAVVKLMRDLLDAVAPGTILLTETNVPHAENISYFGDGDEAQMIYQFSLAPLLLDAFLNSDAGPFVDWLSNLGETPPDTTYFNFTASHDGVGVRPLEGLVSAERFDRLVQAVRDRGGQVSLKRNPDGSDSPYELNTTYFSALGEPGGLPVDVHVRRFLSSQAIMLALKGIPGIYFHSLFATPNDHAGVEETGRARTINRRKFGLEELRDILSDPNGAEATTFAGYRKLLAVRVEQPAFHPNAPQRVIRLDEPSVIAFLRGDNETGQQILLESKLEDATRAYPLGLVLPVTADDMRADPFGYIVEQLKDVSYIDQIVIALGVANDEADYHQTREKVAPLGDRAKVLWTDGQRVRSLYQELIDDGLNVSTPGKGRSVWTAFGFLLADPRLKAFALHDCDIVNYDREMLARLCLPMAHPNFDFDFCKAYYSRVTNKMYGRVVRLLVAPVLYALTRVLGDDRFLKYLRSFRYPLSGEFAVSANLARSNRTPSDWGLEVGTLAEVFRNASTKRVCQVELCQRYEHKHQPMSRDDPKAGLMKMAGDILTTFFRTMASMGTVFSKGQFVTIQSAYLRAAQDMVRQYHADATLNALEYDRHAEEQSVEGFAEQVLSAGETFLSDPTGGEAIPNWNRVLTAFPEFPDRLRQAVEADAESIA